VLQANKDIRISRKDDKALSIEFVDGSIAAGMQITALSETVSQILVVSTSRENRTHPSCSREYCESVKKWERTASRLINGGATPKTARRVRPHRFIDRRIFEEAISHRLYVL
jgi:hypothetical protein